ncbi:MAG: hypothetical protein H2057_03765 [Alphaproteobacteria bacterium]|nr:hypothetical protein [Alphaproteobacteria bacterium]
MTYTDNIDDIHNKCCIVLSRTEDTLDPSGTFSCQSVIYPEQQDLEGKNVVCLPIGQSFDFDAVLSTTYTLAERTQLFVYKDLVVKTGNTQDFFTYNKSTLPYALAKGDLQKTLPALYELVAAIIDGGIQ